MQRGLFSTNTEQWLEICEEIAHGPDKLDLQVNRCARLVQHIPLKKKNQHMTQRINGGNFLQLVQYLELMGILQALAARGTI